MHLTPGIFLFRKGPENLFISKQEHQRGSCLTISVIVFNMASRHLLNMENKGYSAALGSFLLGGNDDFTGYFDASNSVAVNRPLYSSQRRIGNVTAHT